MILGPRATGRVAIVLVGLALVGAFAWAVVRSQAAPEGPRTVVWDRESCAECGMSVGDRRFACQLQAADGRVLDFDDPGCLFRHLPKEPASVRAIYFRDLGRDAWLTREEAGFVQAAHSPMGYDLGAVPKGTPGAIGFEAARTRARATESGHDAR